MTLVIRCDASQKYGQGHTLRCRNLCEAFLKAAPDADIVWAATQETFDLVQPIAQSFKTLVLPAAPQAIQMEKLAPVFRASAQTPILVVDGYHLGSETLEAARGHGFNGPSAHVDEKMNRFLGDHDYVIDFLPRDEEDYSIRGLTGLRTELKSGPAYQMVSSSFEALAEKRAAFIAGEYNDLTRKKHIVLMNGGFNIGGMLEELVEGLIEQRDMWARARFSAFVLGTAKNYDQLEALVSRGKKQGLDITLKPDCRNIPEQLVTADLFVGASGLTPYELGAVGGVASVVMDAGHNQQQIARLLDRMDAGVHAGQFLSVEPDGSLLRSREWTHDQTLRALRMAHTLAFFRGRNQHHAEQSRKFCDGQGAKRVANLLLARRMAHGGNALQAAYSPSLP